MSNKRLVLVLGGAGYVGTVLTQLLISRNFHVRVLDTFWYGENYLSQLSSSKNLELVKADIRDIDSVNHALGNVTDVIHLACISNDPSFDLNPKLGKSINLDAFEPLVQSARNAGVRRFIYASSSSVYGVKEEERVTEELSLDPLTDYSKFKAMCEAILFKYQSNNFVCTVLRPATICGWSPRQRFDLSVNILTNHAINYGRIKVFGGSQYRPNIHIEDMCEAYLLVLNSPPQLINGKIFNVGADNLSLDQIACKVSECTGITNIVNEPTVDLRSYRIDSRKICEELGFKFQRNVSKAISDLVDAFRVNAFTSPLTNSSYFNIERMKELDVH